MTTKNKAAVALGKLGGKTKSPAKADAARANGAAGGRPKLNRYDRDGDIYTVYGLAVADDGYARVRGTITIALTSHGITHGMGGDALTLVTAERGLTGWGWLDCDTAYHLTDEWGVGRFVISGESWHAALADMVARRPEWAAKIATKA